MMNFYLLANAVVKLAYPAFSHNDYAIRYPHSDDLSYTRMNHPTTLDRIRFGFKSALRNAVPTSRPLHVTRPTLMHNFGNIITWAARSTLKAQYTPVMAQVKELARAFQPGRPWSGEELRAQIAPFLVQCHSLHSPRFNTTTQCWTLNPAPGIKGYNHRPKPGYLTFGIPFVLTQGTVGLRTIMQRISSAFHIDNYRYIKEMTSRTLRTQAGLSPTGRMTMTMNDFMDYVRANAANLEEIDVKIIPDSTATEHDPRDGSVIPNSHVDAEIKLPHLKTLKLESCGSETRLQALVMNKLRNLEINMSGHQPINLAYFTPHWDTLSRVVLRCNTTTADLLRLLVLLKPNVHFEWDGSLTQENQVPEQVTQSYGLDIDTVHIRCRGDHSNVDRSLEQLMDVLVRSEKVRYVILNGQTAKAPTHSV